MLDRQAKDQLHTGKYADPSPELIEQTKSVPKTNTILTVRTRSLARKGMSFVKFVMKMQIPTIFPESSNIFHNKSFKISIRNRTIGYRIIQCVVGFLVNDSVPMDTHMTRDPF
jgi:hypothetical protein